MPRKPERRLGWAEHFLNPKQAGAARSCAESTALGHSVLIVENLVTSEEVDALKSEAILTADHLERASNQRSTRTGEHRFSSRTAPPSQRPNNAGRRRMPIANALAKPGQALCDAILLRALSHIAVHTQELTEVLFEGGDCLSGTTCIHNPKLAFSTGEVRAPVFSVPVSMLGP